MLAAATRGCAVLRSLVLARAAAGRSHPRAPARCITARTPRPRSDGGGSGRGEAPGATSWRARARTRCAGRRLVAADGERGSGGGGDVDGGRVRGCAGARVRRQLGRAWGRDGAGRVRRSGRRLEPRSNQGQPPGSEPTRCATSRAPDRRRSATLFPGAALPITAPDHFSPVNLLYDRFTPALFLLAAAQHCATHYTCPPHRSRALSPRPYE